MRQHIEMTKKTTKSDRPGENRISDPILTAGIGSRINEVAEDYGGKRMLAETIGLSEAQLYRIIAGTADPKVETVAAIAVAGHVALEWLATGRGPKKPGEMRGVADYGHQVREGVDPGIIRDVVEALEELAADRYARLSAADKASLVALLCEEIAEQERSGQAVNRRSAVRFALLGR